jgi:hypothetical protein
MIIQNFENQAQVFLLKKILIKYKKYKFLFQEIFIKKIFLKY